jgi:LmbE family N-acetylglucosaminyl deacetylase
LKGQKLLVIAPHPDDEVIGSGGLIQKIKQQGGKVYILFLTVGDTQDFSKKRLSTKTSREKEIEKVARFLKYDDYQIAFPGNEYHLRLDRLGQLEVMDMIERRSKISIEKVKPTIVVFPDPSSYNQDHKIAALSTFASVRTSSSEKHFVGTVLSSEAPGDFWSLGEKNKVNTFVPLSSLEMKKKINALKIYASQWREYPSNRSEEVLRSLAKLRGSQCNSEFGEGFSLRRIII